MAASPSTESFRPLDNLYHILPQGHEKALKHAFYNTAAILFVVFAGGAAVAVYYILEAFVRPLLWAVLCGSFLYPFKRSLTNVLRRWLKGLNSSGTPFVVGLGLLPVVVLDRASDGLGNAIIRNIKIVLGLCAGVTLLYCLYHFAPLKKMFFGIQAVLYYIDEISSYFGSLWVWTIFVGYILVLVFYWSPENNTNLRILASFVWVVLALHIAAVAGACRVPLLLFMIALTVTGLVLEMRESRTVCEDVGEAETGKDGASLKEKVKDVYGKWFEKHEDHKDESEKVEEVGGCIATKRPEKLLLPSKQPSLSDRYFVILFWGFVFVHAWNNLALLYILLPIPVAVFLIKNLVRNAISGGRFGDCFHRYGNDLKAWVSARESLLIPRPVMGLYQNVMRGDGKGQMLMSILIVLSMFLSSIRKPFIQYNLMITILEQSLDAATSTLLILLLVVGVILMAIFSVVQIQRESIHLITVTSNVVNSSLHHPQMIKWVPKSEDMQQAIDSMVQKTHLYGRDWLASKVGDLVSGGGSDQADVEKQIMDVWDQLYQSWFAKNTTEAIAPKPGFRIATPGFSVSGLWAMVSKANTSVVSDAVEFVKENIDTFTSVLESVYTVLKGNVSVVLNITTTFLSVVFGGGTAILNFVLSAVIFLTTLFYLLASSGDQYKPLQWFSNVGGSQGGAGNTLGQAVEAAISGVFTASLKMSAFYGLYTWLTHTAFSINIVFIPSALAAIFAAIPFLGPYWAAIPAVVELWLVHGEFAQAVTLLVCHLLPSSVVDAAIYSEIQGGHPFMTGLAIAGGMMCLGLEGAIIGPILLCCLIVAVNVYGSMLKPDSATNTPSIDEMRMEGKRVHWDLSRPVGKVSEDVKP